MPSWPSYSSRGFPIDLSFLSRLPQAKIRWIPFVRRDISAFHVFNLLPGQFAVFLEFVNLKQDFSIRLISISFLYQPRDEFYYIRDMFAHLRLMRGGSHLDRFHVLIGILDIIAAYLQRILSFLIRLVYYLVVDISEVPHIHNFLSQIFKVVP